MWGRCLSCPCRSLHHCSLVSTRQKAETHRARECAEHPPNTADMTTVARRDHVLLWCAYMYGPPLLPNQTCFVYVIEMSILGIVSFPVVYRPPPHSFLPAHHAMTLDTVHNATCRERLGRDVSSALNRERPLVSRRRRRRGTPVQSVANCDTGGTRDRHGDSSRTIERAPHRRVQTGAPLYLAAHPHNPLHAPLRGGWV